MVASLHMILHYLFVLFGLTANMTSIVVILRKTPQALQEYSVLLLNLAFVELFSVLNHFLVDGRIFYSYPTLMCISAGPCRVIAGRFCASLAAMMNVVMIHSSTLVAISFWYR
ncbi:hypothetical protein PMAYCL1PPCAC_32853, partial [Pristionchus mayeri]